VPVFKWPFTRIASAAPIRPKLFDPLSTPGPPPTTGRGSARLQPRDALTQHHALTEGTGRSRATSAPVMAILPPGRRGAPSCERRSSLKLNRRRERRARSRARSRAPGSHRCVREFAVAVGPFLGRRSGKSRGRCSYRGGSLGSASSNYRGKHCTWRELGMSSCSRGQAKAKPRRVLPGTGVSFLTTKPGAQVRSWRRFSAERFGSHNGICFQRPLH
jgi:hypothetical protein